MPAVREDRGQPLASGGDRQTIEPRFELAAATKMGEDGEHAPVIVRRGEKLELREDIADVRLDRLGRQEKPVTDRLVRSCSSPD
jgi:hypothetical protein